MGIEIPEALQWAAKYVVGAGDWPEGDETAMRRMADAYTTAATTLDDLGDDAQRQVNQLLSALDGQTADAIEAFWKKLGNNDGALSALTGLLKDQADLVDDGANDIEHTKLMIIAQLVIFAVEMAAALAAMATGVGAPAGAAAGAAARVATQAAIRLTMRQLLQRILTRVVKEAALGALEEGGLDLGIRLIQAAKGDRELSRDDFTAVWQSAAGGAIGGAISGGLGREGGLTNGVGETAGEGLGNAVGNRAKQFATDYTTEVASDIGSQAAMAAITGEDFELSADTFTSAATGAAQNQFDRGGNDSGDNGPDEGPDNDPESGNNDREPQNNDNPDRGENNPSGNSDRGENSPNDTSNQPGQTSPANNAGNGGDQGGNNPGLNNQPGQTTPANANDNSGNGNEPPTHTQPDGDPTNSGSNNNPTGTGENPPANTNPNAADEPGRTAPANADNNTSGNGDEPPARTQPDGDPPNTAGNDNPSQTSPTGDSNTPNSTGNPDAGSNHPPSQQPSGTDSGGDQGSGATNPPADQPRSTAPTADEPGNATSGNDNSAGTGSPAQPSSLDLPTQDPSAPQSTQPVQGPNPPDLPPQDTSAGPTQPNQSGTPQQAPTEPGASTQQNQSPSTGAQPTSPTTPTTPSAPASPGDPSQSRPNSTTAPDSPSATQPSQSAPTAPANQPARSGDQTQDTPAGSLDLPGQDSPTTSPGQTPSPLDLPSQDPAPSQEPTPLDLPTQDPAPTQEPTPLDLPPQDPAPTREPTPLDLPDQNPAPGRADDPLNRPDQDGQPTQAPRPLDLPPQDAPVEQTPSPLDLPDPNSPTDPDAQSTTGAPLTTVAPANTTAAAATATAPTLDGGAQSNSPSATGTPTPTSTPPASPQSPTPTTQPAPTPQPGGPASTRPTPSANGPARPTPPRRNDPGTQTNSPTSTGSDAPTSTTPPSPQPADTHATPPPNRPGYDPTIHKYVAHFNDGRPIPRDPFFAGEYNPHIGRYQPTEAEFQAERAQLAANPPESAAPEHNPPTSDHTRPDPTATNTAEPTRTEIGTSSGPAPSLNDGIPATGAPTDTTPASADLHDFTNLEAHRARTQLPSWWPNPARDQANISPAQSSSITNHHSNSTFPDARAPESTPPASPTRPESPAPLGGRPHSAPLGHPDQSPPPTTRPQSTAPQHTAHTPGHHRDPSTPNPAHTHNPIPNTPGTHPHSPVPNPRQNTPPRTRQPQQTPTAQARAAREFYRNRPAIDGRTTPVSTSRSRHSHQRPGYDVRRYELPSGQRLSVISIRVNLEVARNVPPHDVRQFMESVERSVDRAFNNEQRLLSGDALLVDVVYTTDPADAHLQLTVDNNRENLSALPPHSNTDVTTGQIRHQLGLPTVSTTGNPALTQDDLRQLSDDIAASNTPTRLGNPSDLRRFGRTELQAVEQVEYQIAVQDALRTGNGFHIGADPRTHPYGRLINDGGPTVAGRGNNCLDCSLSALSSFFGNPQVSAPRWPDRLANGTLDESTGEFSGLSRAERWLGEGLLSFDNGERSVPEQFASMHSWITQLGPGSAALIVNEWHAWNPETQQFEYNANGTPRSGGTHATVIVYPLGAAGPVWWDPQSGEMSDHPPFYMANTSLDVWFTPIPADQGVNYDAGAVQNQGTGPAVPGADLRSQPELSDRGDRARLAVQPSTRAGHDVQPEGRDDESGSERGDRSGAPVPELAGPENRGRLHTSDAYRTTTDRTSGLPTSEPHQPSPHQRDSRPDRVPGDGTRRAETSEHLPPRDQQTNAGIPTNRDHISSGDVMAGLAQDPGRDLAGSGDDRVLTANDDRSGDSHEIHPWSGQDDHRQNPGPLGHGQEPESRTTAQNSHPPSARQDEVRGGGPRASDHIAGQDRPQTAAPAGLAGPTPAGRPGSSAPDNSSTGSTQPSNTPAHPDEVPRRTLDEVRPFEQPGGLRPVEPEFQQAVENAVPRDSNGEPLVHPPVNHSWVDEINDGGPWADSGRGINCVDATRAGLSTYYGDPQAAAARMLETDEFGRPDWAGEIDGISNMEEWAGARYSYTGTGDDGLDEAMQRVADAGPGASAAVLVEWAPTDPPEIDPDTGLPCDPGSHQLALINDNGRVLWVDFQTRTITDYFPFGEGVGDVWAITMDSDRNPVLDPDQGDPNASTEPPEGPPNRPAGPTGDHGEGADPPMNGRHVSPLLDPEEYLAQPYVAEALNRADEQGTTTMVDGAEMPIGHAIRQLLPQHPELAALLQETDYLEKSLLARPKTLASLMSHPEAIPVLIDAAHEVRDRGPDEILAEHESAPGPEPTPLTPEQHAISEALRASTEDYLDTDRRQPYFDVSRKDDPQYRSQYLDRQYAQWEATQGALNTVVREVALETDGQAGWRNEPKDRVRAEDKVAGYEGNVSRLTDLVGAKIVFDSVSDIYRAAGLLASDERIEIVDFDDRFNEPVGSGYRDLQMKVRMPNGHIAELRLHLSHIDEVAKYEHALYEGRRDLKALAESEGRELTPNESALKAALERRSVEMFQIALERGLA
ncbi:toxin glutamine deamidase domain-containing protein [Nocardia cyriacigeorgica]|uniref:toxin glutamine deamidase domain-containing protein n=1 Tax=Nocardia cyriacigeorgica TaxID=135487 RepID=UPI001893081B|nr:toxin glutamine deamidase domain-containing protein [Nocardia cyriacigeorgica]MBF6412285.1 hypothetical protein [Nocardia cyriacigeorgica]